MRGKKSADNGKTMTRAAERKQNDNEAKRDVQKKKPKETTGTAIKQSSEIIGLQKKEGKDEEKRREAQCELS